MKKKRGQKAGTIAVLIVAVIAIVEFQKFMKAKCGTCTDGSCSWSIIDDQQLPLPTHRTDAAKTAARPQLIDFGAGKCINCKLMKEVLSELRTEYGDQLDIRFVDVWEDEEASKAYSIQLIPTQVFLNSESNELFRHEGFYSKEDILKKWDELGVQL